MKLIIGIGNPGEKYNSTRHNIGFLVLDALKTEILSTKSEILNKSQISNINFQNEKKFNAEVCKLGEIVLVKPSTFMNQSGKAVSALVNFYKIKPDDLYVVHDDLDIRLGEYKIQKGVGPKVHYGIQSIEKSLGKKDFWRVRVGIENRKDKFSIFNIQFSKKIPGEKYVLQKFTNSELLVVKNVIDKVIIELFQVIKK